MLSAIRKSGRGLTLGWRFYVTVADLFEMSYKMLYFAENK